MNMNKTVFISYSWAEPSGGIVNNWLKPSLKDAGISVSVDKDNCQYQDSIEEYEQEIGNADMIIAVVGNLYLESINCMYEIASIFEKGGELSKRLYFIALEKVQSDDQIAKHWSEAKFEVESRLKRKVVAREPDEKKLEKIDLICKYLGEILVYWNDRSRLDFSKVSKDNFHIVVNKILDRINDAEIPSEPSV